MGRGRHYAWWRRWGEAVERVFYGKGWAAKLALRIGLQGELEIDRRSLPLGPRASLSDPLRIGFLSNLHAGPLTSPTLFKKARDALVDFQPHVVLFGGDFVSLHHANIAALPNLLDGLAPSHGMFGVFGNHDLWLDDEFIGNALQARGIRLLVNASVRLAPPFETLSICGLDDPGTGTPDAEAMFANAAEHRLVLSHSPLGLEYLGDHNYHLFLAGHTHGGQIALPNGKPIILPRGSGNPRYAKGHHAHEASGIPILVSNGLGMCDLPVRLAAPSQVHLLTLTT